MNIYFRPDGTAQCLYGEQISLGELGSLDIRRASHVEPSVAAPGEWYADLSPVGGPMLDGFKTRADALAAEEKWLNARMRTQHVQANS
jgi:hypothetical protein